MAKLTFGTGGIRAVLGKAEDQMNIKTVAHISDGFASWVLARCGAALNEKTESPNPDNFPKVVIARDSRNMSLEFAKVAAGVFSSRGITAYFFDEIAPTPLLSYAVRKLGAAAGVVITASHNPSKYNGYKAYNSDGYQLTDEAANEVSSFIDDAAWPCGWVITGSCTDEKEKALCEERFGGNTPCDECRFCYQGADDGTGDMEKLYEIGREIGRIVSVPQTLLDEYVDTVVRNCVMDANSESTKQGSAYGSGNSSAAKDFPIVYTPLNGTGYKFVTAALKATGYGNVTVVEEQKLPDGNFPTCPKPNPEIREAMALGIEYAKKSGAELLIATDPDADRCGIAVKICGCADADKSLACEKASEGADFRLLTGNETGCLLFNYICERRTASGTMPKHPVLLKTIVTTYLADKIAESYGVETKTFLIGFKYLGEEMTKMEKAGRLDDFVFGFEESYGCLSHSESRDKDGVNAVVLICEMFSYYKAQGVSLTDKLEELSEKFGKHIYSLEDQYFEGSDGPAKMAAIMEEYRAKGPDKDFSMGIDGLPKANILQFITADKTVTIRPSGTEPKIKIYTEIVER